MVNTNYPIEALDILLDKACLSERYWALIPCKAALLAGLKDCRRKNEAAALPEEALLRLGLDGETAKLLRRFFGLYDAKPQKFREIAGCTDDPAEQTVLRELYHLPGVRFTRASLYYRAGYRCLRDIADAAPEEILEQTAAVIERDALPCIVPLPKEVRTHIAVAKAFTWE